MQGLPTKYCRHAMEQTGAVVDEPNTLMFEKLKEAVELRMVAVEGAKQMDVLPKEDALNKLDRRREGRLLDTGVREGALTQQQSPSTVD